MSFKYWLSITCYFFIFTTPLFSFAESNNMTANQMVSLCTSNDRAGQVLCNVYFEGYLDGIVNGTLVNWNFPKGQNLSAETIKNSFLKLTHDHPVIGDSPASSAALMSLVQEGIVKERIKNQ